MKNQVKKLRTRNNNIMLFRLIFILSLYLTASCNAQVETIGFDDFSNNFKQLNLPIVVDQITLHNLSIKNNEIAYSVIEEYITDEEKKPLIKVSDTIYNKFYTYGQIKLGDRKGLLFSHINDNKYLYIGIFNESGNLQWFSKLCSTDSSTSIYNDNYATMILSDLMFLKVDEIHKNNSLTVEVYEPKEDILFSSYDCNDYPKCDTYKPTLEEIPLSSNLNLKIDASFLKSLNLLIPIKFCSPVKTSQVLSSIGDENKKSLSSYFIGAKVLKGNRKIIFFLNVYEYENYSNIREVGYQIIDENGKPIKIDSFCEYAEDKEGALIIKKTGEIKDLDNSIEIYSYEYGNTDYVKYDK